MKNLSIAFFVFLIAGFQGFAQEKLEKQLVVPLSKPGDRGSLTIELVNGGMTVTGYNGNEVVIEAGEMKLDEQLTRVPTAVGWASPAPEVEAAEMEERERRVEAEREAREAYFFQYAGQSKDNDDNINRSTEGMKKIGAATFTLNAEEKNNHVEVESGSWQKAIQLNVKVPKNFDLKLTTINRGEIIVKNIDGVLEIENVNGSVTASGVTGTAVVNSVNGSTKVAFDKIYTDDPMSFSTLNGDIELILPSSTKANFKMKTDMGEIFTDFDMAIQQQDPKVEKDNSRGTYKVSLTKWIYGKINGGGPEITMQSMHGDFYIRKK